MNHIYSAGKILSYTVRTVAALHVISSHLVEVSDTTGESMLPTLAVVNDSAVVDKRYKFGRNIEMGDLIVARKPTDPASLVTKRVTGMPGDIILIDPSKNSLARAGNGRSDLREIYPSDSSNYDNYVIVPEGHVWVTGDNLNASLDSRTYSVVPLAMIEGKLTYAWYLTGFLSMLTSVPRRIANTFVEE
ncbi:hypothetical protein OGAPHI_004720 [Ogataea philodendri]|uniref:Mitochondrial inner membrane protease subunit n=1 Tax=Ogataea philodendri TaxID=1378263 RepID=A0A9P8T2T6_9ASCO|nr:uncharacterized protein OGAPHI_004720 [Ogataea philodendri]KAH3664006.1 hypothetical protein OGAPHI_004720 [Ogataea philodendri]